MFRICSFFLALVLAAPLCAGQPEIAGVPSVIDADTIDVAGQRIRLGGIDAPEMSETCLRGDGRPWSCGRWATDQARAMLDGQRLRCVDLGERTYGRVVGRCYLNGQDIAIDLIEAGAARPCLRYARAQGQEAIYTAAEARALRARAGIYGGPLNPVARFCRLPGEEQVASGCEIKGNVSANGQIYHLPGQRHYDSINMNKPGVRWFCSEEAAQAAGWRRAMR